MATELSAPSKVGKLSSVDGAGEVRSLAQLAFRSTLEDLASLKASPMRNTNAPSLAGGSRREGDLLRDLLAGTTISAGDGGLRVEAELKEPSVPVLDRCSDAAGVMILGGRLETRQLGTPWAGTGAGRRRG